MNSCLENIVVISNPCENVRLKSMSDYDLIDAPEINTANMAELGNSDVVKGYDMLKKQLQLAIRDVKNDFLAVLNSNNLITRPFTHTISTGRFDDTLDNPVNNDLGITISRAEANYGSIRNLEVHDVLIYPIEDAEETVLYIKDGDALIQKHIKLVGGQINKFTINYKPKTNRVSIYLKNIATYSSQLTCLLGCNGTKPNDCGYVKGYNNGNEVSREGFGINATFSCNCDYESLLCRFANSFTGKIIYLKARANILNERIYNERLTPYIIYGQDEAEELYTKIENEYRETWNAFVESVPELLNNESSDCFNCKKIQIVVNV